MRLNNVYIPIWVFLCLFMSFECNPCPGRIKDPLWNQQKWYLHKRNDSGYHMNVMPAWRRCINGKGIIVGVVDLGIDDHEDLPINRNISVPYEVEPDEKGWFFEKPKDGKKILTHGTRVAGIIAGKKNDIGVIGIAYGATIADIRFGGKNVVDSFDADHLHNDSDIIDVYSCSFSNFHTGAKSYPLKPDQEQALRIGTLEGRNQLGSVYVFASGNTGGDEDNLFRDSCAYDRLISNRYVIAVAGVQHNLMKMPSGEECSAMMVAAFTARPGSRYHRLWTTDIRNNYTRNFGQSSAAAPMVSGAVSLALQANPRLTYRDVMHLLVKTSRSHIFDQTYYMTNAANLTVSSTFGFGLLNIGKLVRRSMEWKNVPSLQSCETLKSFNMPTKLNNFVIKIAECNARYIEHVEVSLKVDHPQAGQIRWVLVSPYGTRSIILPGRGLDPTKNMDLTVLTVQMWGENPNGYWRLEPKPVFGANLDNGELKSADLTIHGYDCGKSKECLQQAKQVQGSWASWSAWTPCTCGDTTISRHRSCVRERNSDFCIGNSFEKNICEPQNCQTTTVSDTDICPPSTDLDWDCSEHCSTDIDCIGGGKCCANGCGHSCIAPNNETEPISEEVQGPEGWTAWSEWGSCPESCGSFLRIRSRICQQDVCNGKNVETKDCPPCTTRPTCPSSSDMPRTCKSQCLKDSDCGRGKCCFNGCGHTCVAPKCTDLFTDCPAFVGRYGCSSVRWNCRRSCNQIEC